MSKKFSKKNAFTLNEKWMIDSEIGIDIQDKNKSDGILIERSIKDWIMRKKKGEIS